MNNNIKKMNNLQNDFQTEHEIKRQVWLTKRKDLEDKKIEIGYAETSFGELSDEYFMNNLLLQGVSEQVVSDLRYIENEYKNLREEYKLLWPENYIVEEFNERHAVVHTDQTYILREKENIFGGMDFSLESRASFRAYYEDERIELPNGKIKCAADVWLKNPLRRKYSNIVFEPTHLGHTKKFYNLWRGFAYKPKKGDASLYWQHVRDNICDGNEQHFIYLKKWLAYIFQRPDVTHTALVLCGSQGVGKNSFVEPLGKLLGAHYVLLSSIGELVSNFNYHLKNAVLIHANEALWGGNKKELGTLKAMITERTCLIEGKGKDRIMVKNFKHLILSSNEDWPVHIDADDRRFFVLRVSEAHKEDHKYFAAIDVEFKQGGYEALLYDLLNEPLDDFEPRQFPHSDEAFHIKLRSAESVCRYIYEALSGGCFNFSQQGPAPWDEEITREDLYSYYSHWSSMSNETILSKEKLGAAIRKYLPSIQHSRPTIAGKRMYSYKLPMIEELRSDFARAFKTTAEIIFNKSE